MFSESINLSQFIFSLDVLKGFPHSLLEEVIVLYSGRDGSSQRLQAGQSPGGPLLWPLGSQETLGRPVRPFMAAHDSRRACPIRMPAHTPKPRPDRMLLNACEQVATSPDLETQTSLSFPPRPLHFAKKLYSGVRPPGFESHLG